MGAAISPTPPTQYGRAPGLQWTLTASVDDQKIGILACPPGFDPAMAGQNICVYQYAPASQGQVRGRKGKRFLVNIQANAPAPPTFPWTNASAHPFLEKDTITAEIVFVDEFGRWSNPVLRTIAATPS
jgi:hypothetical protein